MRSALARTLAAVLLTGAAGAALAAAKPHAKASTAHAAQPAPAAAAAPAGQASSGGSLLPGTNSKEPINVTANKLDYIKQDNKLIYTGDVVVIQGDTTMKASVLRIDLAQADAAQPGAAPAQGGGASVAPGQGSSVKHMDADGPVTLISKDQIGTGDHAIYDKAENKVYLNGNVTLSQTPAGSDKPNVTQGDHLVYDMTTGQAHVFSGATNGGRVTSVFTPGSGSQDGAKPAATKSPTRETPAGKRSAQRRGAATAAAEDNLDQ